MINRKEIKKEAKKTLKSHYLLFVLVCLIASFIGSEFRGSLIFTDGIEKSIYSNISNLYSQITEDEEIINGSEVISKVTQSIEPVIEREITQSITEKIEPINENIKNLQEKAKTDAKSLSGEKGVFAGIINSISSNNFLITLTKGVLSVVESKNIAYMIIIIMTILIWAAFTMFIIELYKVISRRIFLEGRIYKKVGSDRFLYLFKMKKTIKASFTIFITNMKCSLWGLTIIMLPIKYYEYLMIPYIIAENPKISSKDAIKLSRQMMQGNKWRAFILDLSFIGWNLLGTLTLGIFNIFFTNPYKMCTYSELYSIFRKNAIDDKYIGYKYLNDRFLFEKASLNKISSAYGDIKEYEEKTIKPKFNHGKFKNFILNFLGINILSKSETEEYEKYMVDSYKISQYTDELNLETYPTRLSNIETHVKKKSKRIDTVNYLKPYEITSLIMMFFIMCLIGYVWEVTLNLITVGEFANKGMLHGPWLPIYGSGGLLILVILYKFRRKPILEFIYTVILCGTVEYFTGLIIELTHNGQKWWDYTGYFLNLNGRICAEGLLAFGIGGLAIVYFIAPSLDAKIKKISKKILVPLCVTLLTVFVCDIIYSSKNPNTGKGITEYSKVEYINVSYNLDKN